MSNTYGILNSENCHVDVSNTEQGAKNYATRHDYKFVTVRFNGGYIAKVIAEKIKNKWVKL